MIESGILFEKKKCLYTVVVDKENPSWNTDQGVKLTCEWLGGILMRGVKAKVVLSAKAGYEEWKHICLDPKDGDLYLSKTKSEEILMEVWSDTDVQIVRQIEVKGRKTNRTVW